MNLGKYEIMFKDEFMNEWIYERIKLWKNKFMNE